MAEDQIAEIRQLAKRGRQWQGMLADGAADATTKAAEEAAVATKCAEETM